MKYKFSTIIILAFLALFLLSSCSDIEPLEMAEGENSVQEISETNVGDTTISLQTQMTEELIKQTADPKEFVGLYIKALCEGDAEALNLLYGKELFTETQADPVLETDPYSEIDGITRVIETEDGFIVSESVKDSDVYFVRDGNCIGYTCYIRNTGNRFVMVATAKYAFEFAECAAEDYSLFPYTEDFRIAPDDKTLSESFPAELLTEIITSALKKGDIRTLKTLCKDMTFDEPQHAEGEPTPVNRAPFGYAGAAAEVICKPENDTTVLFEVKTLDGNTVNLTATLKKDGDGYCLSTLAAE
ncbi:MAG: hypothetical protein IJL30_02755 [Clostridia bacterium]|nr:hypothetical protein [Clostridia bacterium]